MENDKSSKLQFTIREAGKESKQTVEIPLQGNLALLAFGDIGLMAWRQKKAEFIKEVQAKKELGQDQSGETN